MFGKNEIAWKRPASDGLLVHSIFYTIQGEGPWAGRPAIFVRLAGCNLRCFWCDTDFAGGLIYDAEDLAEAVARLGAEHRCDEIVLTGGEPLLQEAVPAFCRALPSAMTVQIETAGTVWPGDLLAHVVRSGASDPKAILVCSPKTPKVHPMIAEHAHSWKYILRRGETCPVDGLPRMSTQLPGLEQRLFRPWEHRLPERRSIIYVQACDEQDAVLNSANLALAAQVAMQFGYRLSVQIHKLANLP